MAHMYERVIHIITKPPDQRECSEIETILPWFRKKAELFKELKTEILLDIVKNCDFETCQRDTVIIRQGEKGDKFYIILTGTVSVHINTNLTDEDFEAIKQKQLEEETSLKHNGKTKQLNRSSYGTYMAKILNGKSFGDYALIRADSVRNATIIADEPTDLLVVNRDLYNRSLHAYQAQQYERKYAFVDEFPLFSGWNPRYKKMVAMSLITKHLKFEDTVIKQTHPVDGLHFIVSGQVKIVVDPSQHPAQYPTLFPTGDIATLEREKARELLRREMNLEKSKTVDKKMTFQKRKTPQPEGKKPTRLLELCLMGAVDVIGDLEVALGLTTYAQSVICTQEAEVFQLDQRNYDRLIEKRNPLALKMMKNIVHTKLMLHFSRLNEEKLPLFRYFLYVLDEKEKKEQQGNMSAEKSSELGWNRLDSLFKGPLVDIFGPGSVFYMIRMREEKKKKQSQRTRQFGGSKIGVASQSNFTFGAKSLPEVKKTRILIQEAPLYVHRENSSVRHTPFITEKTPTPTLPSPPRITYQSPDGSAEDFIEDTELFRVEDDRGRESTGSDSDDAIWNGADGTLLQLERRIQAWHSSIDIVDARNSSSAVKRAVKLHRYRAVEDRKPRPGNIVVMRQRETCQSAANVSPCDDEMAHFGEMRSRPPSAGDVISRITDQVSKPTDLESGRDSSLKVGKSDQSKCGRSCKHKKPKKQYTVEEYQALKDELRRRQRAYKSFLPMRTSYTIF